MTKREAKLAVKVALLLLPDLAVLSKESKVGNWHMRVERPDGTDWWASRDFHTAISLTVMSAEEANGVLYGLGETDKGLVRDGEAIGTGRGQGA
jgi:hypothetical protein